VSEDGTVIIKANADGSKQVRLTRRDQYASTPVWGKGGRIAYSRYGGTDDEIWTMKPDGSDKQQLTKNGKTTYDFVPDWSPDGTRLVYTRIVGGVYDLIVMNADGTNKVNITDDAKSQGRPAWSPNGQWIVFNQTQNGTDSIYKIRPNGEDKTAILNEEAQDFWPDWQPKPAP
jgi:TolB protein